LATWCGACPRRLEAELGVDRVQFLDQLFRLELFRAQKPGQFLALLGQRVCSPRISISSSLRKDRSRMLRMASAWTSVSAEGLHQLGLGLILGADDLDHLVQVQKTAR
jgi:hypothetical protein